MNRTPEVGYVCPQCGKMSVVREDPGESSKVYYLVCTTCGWRKTINK